MGETCVCSDVAPQQVTVCLSWPGEAPEPVYDFRVDFDCTGCDEAPEVELITGSDDWRIWAVPFGQEIPPQYGNLGRIWATSIWGPVQQVTIAQPDGDPGVNNIREIDLHPPGYAALRGGVIAGNLTDYLYIEEDLSSGLGGQCTLEIQGTLQGYAFIPKATDVVITEGLEGSLAQLIVEDIEESGRLVIGPDLVSCATGVSSVSSGIFVGTVQSYATLLFDGNLADDLTIGEIDGGTVEVEGGVEDVDIIIDDLASTVLAPVVKFGTDSGQTCAFYGDLDLNDSLFPGAELVLGGPLQSGALIDLTAAALQGQLSLNGGGAGSVITGSVHNGGVLTLGAGGNAFSGSATVVTVVSGGEVRTTGNSDLSGSLTVTTNVTAEVNISGDVASSAEIAINGYHSGNLAVGASMDGRIDIDGMCNGTISITSDCDGVIDIGQALRNDIGIGGSLSGSITAEDSYLGDINIGGDITTDGFIKVNDECSGVINVAGSVEGSIEVGGNEKGDVSISGDLTNTGSITVGELANCKICPAGGRIIVEGMTDGPITVNGLTGAISLIHLAGGLDDDGIVTVNANEGDNSAYGDIRVGPAQYLCCPPPEITYAGCIRVLDNGAGSHGALYGDIDIIGCIANDIDPGVTIEGRVVGDIDIEQTDCIYQATPVSCE